jgi:hypothetical protein
MDCMNAFSEGFERFVAKDHTVRAATKRVNYQIPFACIEEHDGPRATLKAAQLTNHAKSFERAFAQL